MSYSLDTAQVRSFVWPGLVPICLQNLSIDDTSRQIWVLLHRHLRNLARAFSTCMLRLTLLFLILHMPATILPGVMLKHERGQYKKIKPKLNKQSRQSPTTHIHSVDVDVGFYCMCEQQKLKRLCAFAQMRSLARAFAIRIQNISTFRRR